MPLRLPSALECRTFPLGFLLAAETAGECSLDVLVPPGGGYPQTFFSLAGGGSHVPDGCSYVLCPTVSFEF
eukprot:2716454-Pyramimonas_sp.AAC.1